MSKREADQVEVAEASAPKRAAKRPKTKALVSEPEADLRPAPREAPPIWADGRQRLCDALPYFKSHQGSLYTHDKIAMGILLDGEVTKGDMVTANVIITSLGGGRSKGEGGVMERTKEGSPHLRASCSHSMVAQRPIGVIVGENYSILPVHLPHAYCVLDWFTITHMWCEKDPATKVKIFKIRLEKTNQDTTSWWMPEGTADLPASVNKPESKKCDLCGEESVKIFSTGWTCLNGDCQAFKDLDIFETAFTYADSFVNQRSTLAQPQEPIVPELPCVDLTGQGLTGTEKSFRDGIVCPQCCGCMTRGRWIGWVYETQDCGFSLAALPVPIGAVASENEAQKKFRTRHCSNIQKLSHQVGPYEVEQYMLPDDIEQPNKVVGTLTIFRANAAVNSRVDGPDSLWQSLQDDMNTSFDLKRNPAFLKDSKGQSLTRHFQQNWGAPYKFAVPVDSKAFSDATVSVMKSLQRLEWAGKKALDITMENFTAKEAKFQASPQLESEFKSFNELLSLAYMKDDMIGYHDDGENTLGPTVATLSLGSPATMGFRAKEKVKTKGKKANEAKKAESNGTKTKGKRKEAREAVLRFSLFHGDMVVMHGAEIQKHFEHMVKPNGIRRLAMTGRYIDPDKLPSDKVRAEAALQGAIPDWAAGCVYDGL